MPSPFQFIKWASRGVANGLASLDAGGKLPTTQLPNGSSALTALGAAAVNGSNVTTPGTWRTNIDAAKRDLTDVQALSALATSRQFTYDAALSSELVAGFRGGNFSTADSTVLVVADGTVTLPASTTNYVGFDFHDLIWRALPRAIDTGFVAVARVVTGVSSITSVTPLPFSIPATRLIRTKTLLAQGAPVKLLLVGDSITAGSGGSVGNRWFELCFDVAQVAKGYNLIGAAGISYENLGVSSGNVFHGLPTIAEVVASPSTISQHPTSVWAPNQQQVARTAVKTASNKLIRSLPDCVLIGLGTNSLGLATDALWLELTVRAWRRLGVEVLLFTTNSRTDGFTTAFLDSAVTIRNLADATGAAIADTWAEIAQARALGLDPTPDGVHPGDTHGQIRYARAIRRNLNSYVQLPTTIAPGPRKLFRATAATQKIRTPNSAIYQPFQGVTGGGTVITASANPVNYNVALTDIAAGSSLASLPVGGQTYFQVPMAAGVYLAYELTTGETATVKITGSGGDVKTGIALGALSNRTLIAELLSFTEIEALSGALQPSGQRNYVPNIGGRLEVTALGGGATALRVQGFLFPSWESQGLDPLTFERVGTWSTEGARNDTSYLIPYTDTLNSEIIIPFEGAALQLTIQTGSVSGSGATISAWVDDAQILTNVANDPYGGGSTGGFTNNVVLMPRNSGAASGVEFSRSHGKHVARVRLTAVGSTATAAQNRNLAIASARALVFA